MLNQNPADVEAVYGVGRVSLMKAMQNQENKRKYLNYARQAYEKAVKVNNHDPRAWVGRGRVLAEVSTKREWNWELTIIKAIMAKRVFDRALDLDPDNYQALSNRADIFRFWSFLYEGFEKWAIEDLKRILMSPTAPVGFKKSAKWRIYKITGELPER